MPANTCLWFVHHVERQAISWRRHGWSDDLRDARFDLMKSSMLMCGCCLCQPLLGLRQLRPLPFLCVSAGRFCRANDSCCSTSATICFGSTASSGWLYGDGAAGQWAVAASAQVSGAMPRKVSTAWRDRQRSCRLDRGEQWRFRLPSRRRCPVLLPCFGLSFPRLAVHHVGIISAITFRQRGRSRGPRRAVIVSVVAQRFQPGGIRSTPLTCRRTSVSMKFKRSGWR